MTPLRKKSIGAGIVGAEEGDGGGGEGGHIKSRDELDAFCDLRLKSEL